MSFGFANDSTQDFRSPYAGTVAFLFRDTTPQDLDTTMRSLGACPKAKLGHGWLFPRSGQPLLDFDLIEDVVDYAIDLVWESWKFYTPLLEALGVKEENALIVRVAVRDEALALKAMRTFALKLLENHSGVVRDSNTEQVWTRVEIANNSIRLGAPGASSRGVKGMAMGLEGRIDSRKTAPFHVQLELDKSQGVPRVPSITRVQGRAIRVFRTNGRLAVGDHTAFALYVCRPGDEPTGPAYIYFDELMRATHIEVYLNGTPPECELAAYEFSVIDAPSEQPYLTVRELESLPSRCKQLENKGRASKAKSWWQFWKP